MKYIKLIIIGIIFTLIFPISAYASDYLGLTPIAAGTDIQRNEQVWVDLSNRTDGYIMVRYTGPSADILRVRITGPNQTPYTYMLEADNTYNTFPISDGNGSYQVEVFRRVVSQKYESIFSHTFSVALHHTTQPFLYPNAYVSFDAKSKTSQLASELTAGKQTEAEKINAIYNYVIQTISYDTELADTVTSGYTSNVDTVLENKKGICLDYASVLVAMLRSQRIPAQLVVGYAGTTYHAWVNVYATESGMLQVDGQEIPLEAHTWKRLDPTFTANSKSNPTLSAYIGNAKNYQAKFIY